MPECGIRPAEAIDPVVAAVLRRKGAWSQDPRCFRPSGHDGPHRYRCESDHPLMEVAKSVEATLAKNPRAAVFQKFTCQACGARQTMPDANVLYLSGLCDECQEETPIERNGCNFILFQQIGGTDAQFRSALDALGGSSDDDTRPDA
jgi:hypothetical protein